MNKNKKMSIAPSKGMVDFYKYKNILIIKVTKHEKQILRQRETTKFVKCDNDKGDIKQKEKNAIKQQEHSGNHRDVTSILLLI